MTIEELKKRKEELGYTLEEISDRTGIPLSTVQKVFSGHTASPRYSTWHALENLLAPGGSRRLGEEAFVWNAGDGKRALSKPQGSYTVNDYLKLPDERRCELIDGVLYDMASPTETHQIVVEEIFVQLHNALSLKKGTGRCRPHVAPLDVRFENDDRTVVQPDVMIVCKKDKPEETASDPKWHGIDGAPDFIAEVVSPSTRRMDISIKNGKYAQAGVREYWVVDPGTRTIMVFKYEEKDEVQLYTFQDRVPVGIFDGNVQVDFAGIGEILDEMPKRG